jgi:hypothetical protein
MTVFSFRPRPCRTPVIAALLSVRGLRLGGRNDDPLAPAMAQAHRARSRALYDYAAFTAKVREYKSEGMTLDHAIKASINYCEKYDIMKAYLMAHGSGVRNMLLTEWDFEEEKRIAIEEALEDAEEKVKAAEAQAKAAEAQTIAINAKNLKALDVDVDIISKATGLPIERINEL